MVSSNRSNQITGNQDDFQDASAEAAPTAIQQDISQGISRVVAVVKKALDVWRHSVSMMFILNAGTGLRIVPIIFDQKLKPQCPAVKWAVEFNCQGQHYYAGSDRFEENTAVADPQRAEEVVDPEEDAWN